VRATAFLAEPLVRPDDGPGARAVLEQLAAVDLPSDEQRTLAAELGEAEELREALGPPTWPH